MNKNKHAPTVELMQEWKTKVILHAFYLIIHNSIGQEKWNQGAGIGRQ